MRPDIFYTAFTAILVGIFGVYLVEQLGLVSPPETVPGANVEIIRDNWGIPHVFGVTDSDAFFGWGYATAEDRLYQMHLSRRAMQGRLAETIGFRERRDENGALVSNTIQDDQKMRYMQFYKYAVERVPNLDADTQSALDAYSRGVNQYIQDNINSLSPLFNGELPEPWTSADSLVAWDHMAYVAVPSSEALLRHQFDALVTQLGSPSAAAAAMATHNVIYEEGAVISEQDVPARTKSAIMRYAAQHPPFANLSTSQFASADILPSKGSQGWALGGTRTTTGSSVLVAHPQIDIFSPGFWHEIHVKGATFDARGIAVPGAIGFFIGFNRNVSWTATAANGDQADLFRLTMRGPDQYVWNGAQTPMTVWDEQINVKGEPSQTITIKRTNIGPVVTPLVPQATPGEEYALRSIPQWDTTTHTVQGLIAMMRATKVGRSVSDPGSLMEASGKYRAPGIHFLAADSRGNVGYRWAIGMPTRSSLSPLAGVVAQDGSSSQYDWVESVPSGVMPHVINPRQGAVYAANNAAVGSWYGIPLGARPLYAGDTIRSWRLRELIEQKPPIYNAPDVFTPEAVKDLRLDTVNPAKRELVRAAIYVRDNQNPALLSANVLSVLPYLEQWYQAGARNVLTNSYQAPAQFVDLRFRSSQARGLTQIYGDSDPGLTTWLRNVKQRLDAGTGTTFDSYEIGYLNFSLGAAWTNTVACLGSDESQWLTRMTQGPMLSSCPSALSEPAGQKNIAYFNTLMERYGSLDPMFDRNYTGLMNDEGNTIWSQKSDAYSHFVDFTNVDGSLAIMPTGISENPKSPYFSDQMPIWTSGNMRNAALDRAVITGTQFTTQTISTQP